MLKEMSKLKMDIIEAIEFELEETPEYIQFKVVNRVKEGDAMCNF